MAQGISGVVAKQAGGRRRKTHRKSRKVSRKVSRKSIRRSRQSRRR